MLRRRGSRLIVLLVVGYGAMLTLVADQPLRTLTTHLLIFLAAFVPALAVLAQFVLPARTQSDRTAVIARLFSYVLGERGAVTYVQDGIPRAPAGERQRRGPGVIWVDHLSAAVLRTDADLTRTIGPGELAFTEPGEWLADGLDLRRQRRQSGGQINSGSGAAGALTRDGIPVSATLSVTFMLDRRTRLQRRMIADPPPIRPAPAALQAAVYGQLVGESDGISWSELPLRLVVDLWREFVKERSLNEFLADQQQVIGQIEQRILRRLAVDSDRQGSGPELRVLRERGIRVLDISIADLKLPEDIQEERLQAWYDSWSGPVRRQLAEADALVRAAARHGEAQASARLAHRLTHKLRQQIRLQPDLSQRDSLILVLEDAAQFAAEDPKLAPLASQIRDVLEQVKARESDCMERRA